MATTDPTKYRGKKIPSFPYDQSKHRPAILILPIVQGSEIIGYLPAKSRDNGDGTATLEVDTELTLNGNVIIDNIRIASTNGIDANRFLLIDPNTGFLQVQLPPPSAPAGTIEIDIVVVSNITGAVDNIHAIPNGAELTIQQLRHGSAGSINGAKAELFLDATGTGSPLVLIDELFSERSTAPSSTLLRKIIGDGTKQIILRRTLIGGGSATEVFGAWRGFEK